MVVSSRDKAQALKHSWSDHETSNGAGCSPERSKVWTEPKLARNVEKKVAVVYYLSRNGHLEHPHFMEITLTSIHGLFLRDVINRLIVLRGREMVKMYSWSSKRSYRNGFVWHDLTEDDFIHPVNGNEYVLKGTEILHHLQHSTTSPSSTNSQELQKTSRDESSAQSEDTLRRRRRRAVVAENSTERAEMPQAEEHNKTTELSRDEISPPPSSSSPETLEALIKADCRRIRATRSEVLASQVNAVGSGGCSSGRGKASAVLMHLFSCGSIAVKEHGVSLVSQYKGRMPRGVVMAAGRDVGEDDDDEEEVMGASFGAMRLEEKEYFSGSLVETKKMMRGDDVGEFSGLKRSSSYNADRGLKMELSKEVEGVRVKCMPRKAKSRSTHGSKMIDYEPNIIS